MASTMFVPEAAYRHMQDPIGTRRCGDLAEDRGEKNCLELGSSQVAHALRLDGHKVLREVYLDIEWEGLLVERAYRMDLVVDDRVVVEAKTVEKMVDANFAQINTQLRFSGYEVGLLLNFRQWPLKEGGIKRVVHTRS